MAIQLTIQRRRGQTIARVYELGGSKLSEQLQSKRSAILLCCTILHALQMALKFPMMLSWLYAVVSMKCRLHSVQVGRDVWQRWNEAVHLLQHEQLKNVSKGYRSFQG
jgi:hypothetical protein